MNETLKKHLCTLLIVVLIGLAIFGIYKFNHRWDEENFIGLSYQEITRRYGRFDKYRTQESGEHVLWGTYITKAHRAPWFGINYDEYVIIHFDENGIAYKCEYTNTGVGG
ncbi:MAG: hypothetical protein J6A88_01955 [Oscillospiraceae bacterium]|nr:hypothetical protein [Oscillospiraceae bacterium]